MSAAQPRARAAETLLLGAIHAWTAGHVPRLARVFPARAREGEPVVLEGERLLGDELIACFGPASTWAVALSDTEAVAVVPSGAAAGLVHVQRQGLRSNSVSFGGPEDDGPAWVVRVDPRDGASGVLRDAPVLARLSRPADPKSLSEATFRVEAEGETLRATLRTSPDGLVVIWQGEDLLNPGVEHVVVACGLRDAWGRAVAAHRSRFVPCNLARADLRYES